jgi:drug/metabolite transporter (DMT)-like permease
MVLINLKFGRKRLIKKEYSYFASVVMLVVAGIIWGLSFTCVKWALVDFTTTQLLFYRFFLAFVLGEALLFLFKKEAWKKSHSDILLSLKPGLFLGISLLFQIHGLHYTTATNSGFITSIYVILIPFISVLLFKTPIKKMHFMFAILAFIGMAFLLDIPTMINGHNHIQFNIGDLLTLGSAVTAAFQIIYIGITAKKSANTFRYNNYQTFWSLCVVIPFLIFESIQKSKSFIPESVHTQSLLGIGLLIVFVSMVAFYLQVTAQQKLSTTTASMLCLLEAPFSFLFAAILIDENLIGLQIFGALLILSSSAFSVYIDRPKNG